MQPTIPIGPIRASQQHQIRLKDAAVGLEPRQLAHQHVARFGCVVQARPTPASLHACSQQVAQPHAIVVAMLVQGFDGGRSSATVVLHQRHEHPTHRHALRAHAIRDVLALDDLLVFAR